METDIGHLAARVTVVIPTHNRESLLRRAINSVVGQSQPPGEVLVVDDCSSDGTPGLIASYGAAVRSMRFERNRERGAARNAGVESARGDLIAFLDSDDEWEPEKLARQLRRFGPVASVTGIRYVDAESQPTGGVYLPAADSQAEILTNNALMGSPSSLLIPREDVIRVGGFPEAREMQGSEDWVFLVKLTLAGIKISVLREPVVRHRIHPGSSTQEADNLARSMWATRNWMDRNRVGAARARAERRSRVAGAIACAYLAERRLGDARDWTRRALGAGPAQVRMRTAGRITRSAVAAAVGRNRP